MAHRRQADGSTNVAIKHRTRVSMSEKSTRTALQMAPKAPLKAMSGSVSTPFEREISADPSNRPNEYPFLSCSDLP